MDIFDNIYKRIAERFEKYEKETILALGVYVEYGFDFLADAKISMEEYKTEARKLGASVRLEQLLADKYFMLSARLGYTRCRIKDKEKYDEFFIKHLFEIFPQTFAEKLYEEMIVSWRLDSANLASEIQELYLYRQSFQNTNNVSRVDRTARTCFTTGTPTYLLKCPECSAQKRCDAKTKNFACRSCGYSDVRKGG